MLIAALALAALAVLLITWAARGWRRRREDEIRSIEGYHHRLDSLHVEQQDRGGSVKLVAGDEADQPGALPPRPRLDPDTKVDLSIREGEGREGTQGRHGREWALGRSQPRARVENATVLVVTAVMVGLLVLGIAGYLIRHDSSGRTTTTTTSQPTTTTSQPTTTTTGLR